MSQDAVRAFLVAFLAGIPPVQHGRLAEIVLALILAGRAGFREIARKMPGPKSVAAKLSEVYRFCQEVPSGRELRNALVHLLVSNSRGGRVVLATDWTEMGGFSMLVTALVTTSRALPLMWTTMPVGGDQAATECEHYLDLQRVLPAGLSYIVLADRGFGITRVINCLHFCHFVLRSKSKIGIRKPGDEKFTLLSKIGYRTGRIQDFGTVDYCASNTARVRVVRVRGAGQKEPWILLTNLDAPAKTIIRLYAARFRIEQMFRDYKSGLHLRGRFFGSVESFDCMLAVATCAFLLFELTGLHAKKRGWHIHYQAGSGHHELARWRIGRHLALDNRRGIRVQAHHVLAQAHNVTLKVGQWDWIPRPHERLDEWPALTGDEVPLVKRNRGVRTERPCDTALRQRLYELLAQAKRTQKALAAAIGMKKAHLNSILRGRQPAAACWLPRFADFLGISEAELIGTTGWIPARKGGRRKADVARKRGQVPPAGRMCT